MAVVNDIQRRMANTGREDFRIGQGHDRVIVAVHDECLLAQAAERGANFSIPGGQQLMRYPRPRDARTNGCAPSATQGRAGMLRRISRHRSPRGMPGPCSARADELREHRYHGRHHDDAQRGRAAENQPAATHGKQMRKLLRRRAAPRYAEHIDGFFMASFDNSLSVGTGGVSRLTARAEPAIHRRRGCPNDDAPLFQGRDKRLQPVQVRADAVENKQGQGIVRRRRMPTRSV